MGRQPRSARENNLPEELFKLGRVQGGINKSGKTPDGRVLQQAVSPTRRVYHTPRQASEPVRVERHARSSSTTWDTEDFPAYQQAETSGSSRRISHCLPSSSKSSSTNQFEFQESVAERLKKGGRTPKKTNEGTPTAYGAYGRSLSGAPVQEPMLVRVWSPPSVHASGSKVTVKGSAAARTPSRTRTEGNSSREISRAKTPVRTRPVTPRCSTEKTPSRKAAGATPGRTSVRGSQDMKRVERTPHSRTPLRNSRDEAERHLETVASTSKYTGQAFPYNYERGRMPKRDESRKAAIGQEDCRRTERSEKTVTDRNQNLLFEGRKSAKWQSRTPSQQKGTTEVFQEQESRRSRSSTPRTPKFAPERSRSRTPSHAHSSQHQMRTSFAPEKPLSGLPNRTLAGLANFKIPLKKRKISPAGTWASDIYDDGVADEIENEFLEEDSSSFRRPTGLLTTIEASITREIKIGQRKARKIMKKDRVFAMKVCNFVLPEEESLLNPPASRNSISIPAEKKPMPSLSHDEIKSLSKPCSSSNVAEMPGSSGIASGSSSTSTRDSSKEGGSRKPISSYLTLSGRKLQKVAKSPPRCAPVSRTASMGSARGESPGMEKLSFASKSEKAKMVSGSFKNEPTEPLKKKQMLGHRLTIDDVFGQSPERALTPLSRKRKSCDGKLSLEKERNGEKRKHMAESTTPKSVFGHVDGARERTAMEAGRKKDSTQCSVRGKEDARCAASSITGQDSKMKRKYDMDSVQKGIRNDKPAADSGGYKKDISRASVQKEKVVERRGNELTVRPNSDFRPLKPRSSQLFDRNEVQSPHNIAGQRLAGDLSSKKDQKSQPVINREKNDTRERPDGKSLSVKDGAKRLEKETTRAAEHESKLGKDKSEKKRKRQKFLEQASALEKNEAREQRGQYVNAAVSIQKAVVRAQEPQLSGTAPETHGVNPIRSVDEAYDRSLKPPSSSSKGIHSVLDDPEYMNYVDQMVNSEKSQMQKSSIARSQVSVSSDSAHEQNVASSNSQRHEAQQYVKTHHPRSISRPSVNPDTGRGPVSDKTLPKPTTASSSPQVKETERDFSIAVSRQSREDPSLALATSTDILAAESNSDSRYKSAPQAPDYLFLAPAASYDAPESKIAKSFDFSERQDAETALPSSAGPTEPCLNELIQNTEVAPATVTDMATDVPSSLRFAVISSTRNVVSLPVPAGDLMPDDPGTEQFISEEPEGFPLPAHSSTNLTSQANVSMQPRKPRMCRRCRNHGLDVLMHKSRDVCPNKECDCNRCKALQSKSTKQKRNAMRSHVPALIRAVADAISTIPVRERDATLNATSNRILPVVREMCPEVADQIDEPEGPGTADPLRSVDHNPVSLESFLSKPLKNEPSARGPVMSPTSSSGDSGIVCEQKPTIRVNTAERRTLNKIIEYIDLVSDEEEAASPGVSTASNALSQFLEQVTTSPSRSDPGVEQQASPVSAGPRMNSPARVSKTTVTEWTQGTSASLPESSNLLGNERTCPAQKTVTMPFEVVQYLCRMARQPNNANQSDQESLMANTTGERTNVRATDERCRQDSTSQNIFVPPPRSATTVTVQLPTDGNERVDDFRESQPMRPTGVATQQNVQHSTVIERLNDFCESLPMRPTGAATQQKVQHSTVVQQRILNDGQHTAGVSSSTRHKESAQRSAVNIPQSHSSQPGPSTFGGFPGLNDSNLLANPPLSAYMPVGAQTYSRPLDATPANTGHYAYYNQAQLPQSSAPLQLPATFAPAARTAWPNNVQTSSSIFPQMTTSSTQQQVSSNRPQQLPTIHHDFQAPSHPYQHMVSNRPQAVGTTVSSGQQLATNRAQSVAANQSHLQFPTIRCDQQLAASRSQQQLATSGLNQQTANNYPGQQLTANHVGQPVRRISGNQQRPAGDLHQPMIPAYPQQGPAVHPNQQMMYANGFNAQVAHVQAAAVQFQNSHDAFLWQQQMQYYDQSGRYLQSQHTQGMMQQPVFMYRPYSEQDNLFQI